MKIAVQIKQIKDADGTEVLKATVPMNLIFEKDFDAKRLNEELQKFECKYLKLVDSLKTISRLIKDRQRRGKVILYWMLGDEIQQFSNENKSSNLFLENQLAHLIRDTGLSEKMISRCRKFRLRYPNIEEIDPGKCFDNYIKTFEQGYISAKKSNKRKESKHA